MHKLTTRLAKIHVTIVAETLNVSGMLAQKHTPGAGRRSRNLADDSMSEVRRQLTYPRYSGFHHYETEFKHTIFLR